MKKHLLKSFIVLILLFIAYFTVSNFTVKALGGGDFYYIVTNMSDDTATEINICYQSDKDSGTYVEYTLATDPDFENVIIKEPTVTKQVIPAKESSWVATGFPEVAYKCEVTLSNLTPNTNYIYRVTNGVHYSDVYKFKTAAGDGSFTFAAMADPQFSTSFGANAWYEVMDKAYAKDPNLAFTAILGDWTERGGIYQHWDYAFNCPKLKDAVIVATPGNHDYYSSNSGVASVITDNSYYNWFVNNPKNGAPNTVNSSYYFKYNNTLFVCIDSEAKEGGTWSTQIPWFKKVVSENPSEFVVVFMHTSVYGSANYSNADTLRKAWLATFDEYSVDLVISGHDHIYNRSHRLYNNKVTTDSNKGTIYVTAGVGGAGTKYDTSKLDKSLSAFNLDKTTTYGIVSVKPGIISYTCYNKEGNVVDSFSIPAKRPATIEDGFNKYKLMEDIYISTFDNDDRTKVKVNWPSYAYGYVNKIKVVNEKGSTIFNQFIYSDRFTNTQVNNLAINTEYKWKVIVELVDGEILEQEYDFNTSLNFGRIYDVVCMCAGSGFNLSWKQAMDNELVSFVLVYVNGEVVKKVRPHLLEGSFNITDDLLKNHNEVKLVALLANGVTEIEYFSCVKDLGLKEDPVITLDGEKNISIKVNDSFNVNATVNEDYVLEYKSSDETVATVDENGKVTALKEGEVNIIISVKDEDVEESITIKVEALPELKPDPVEPKPSGCNSATAMLYLSLSLLGFVLIRRKFN